MDKIFKAIGRFFKGIWNWIKTTAWVQPLLIVVIVFLIIFSFSSSSPLMKWIKSLSNTDTTGEFFNQHKKVAFHELYGDIYSRTPELYDNCEEGKRPDGSKAGTALSEQKNYDGYSYVLFIKNDASESAFKTFYYNTLEESERSHFYVIDFRDEKNQKSNYNTYTGKWMNDNSAVYYDYLLDHLYNFYNSESYDTFNKQFNEKYGYDAKFSDEWALTSSTKEDAVNDLKFPAICKYKGTELIDFRFCDDFSSNYGKDDSVVLSNFHAGL